MPHQGDASQQQSLHNTLLFLEAGLQSVLQIIKVYLLTFKA